jgi:hypothetical protein
MANRHELRAYGAAQLAAALELNRVCQGVTELISSDRELNNAAATEGLSVDDPTKHL